jgi:formamidopyrimidine-DNA glycosylase
MPEGCEVCLTSLFLKRKLRKKTITNVNVVGGKYSTKPFDGYDKMKKKLPLKIMDVDSKGKFMWFTMIDNNNNKYYMTSAFGLTGEWGFVKEKYSHVKFNLLNRDLSKKAILWYTDFRNFGTIKFTSDYNEVAKKLQTLGPDLLKTSFITSDIMERIKKILPRRSSAKIVSVLMDQGKFGIGSGIGNYLVAEILYEAKISPHRTMKYLYNHRRVVKRLTYAIKKLFRTCYINNRTHYITHLGSFLNKHKKRVKNGKVSNYRNDVVVDDMPFVFKVYRQTKEPSGNKVSTEEIVKGRTTYWVKELQKY